MQNNNVVLHVRMDQNLKEKVSTILSSLGMNESDAVKLFYKQIYSGLPFEVKISKDILVKQELEEELYLGEDFLYEEKSLTLEESKKKLGL
ncbi:MAG: type II toxin-antitoxin system RelB/DinJ family antitoxin [Anaeroplasmataceae bacterium]|nr:type II toxin-antitoxin system RelB/DinJ family antitoxin [Anaeroplasmataceae bacterium]HRF70280.1 type II toxin-antitoxin system RelB/DinJ family antitoxin [Candidatus Pelethenecus sp.]